MHHEWSRDLATAVQVCCLLRVDGGFISRSDGIGGFISKDEKVGFVLNNDRDVAISYSGSALFWSFQKVVTVFFQLYFKFKLKVIRLNLSYV